ncbi:hypothetical protein BY458DRAFT_438649 [Sporodiniella umbellata]|nr:hypothetical protein BY458DRAFT_438649 [Sporodiniella umbellata]
MRQFLAILAWPLILNTPEKGQVDNKPYIEWLQRLSIRMDFYPKQYGQSQMAKLLPYTNTTSSYSMWIKFWNLKVEPRGRSL